MIAMRSYLDFEKPLAELEAKRQATADAIADQNARDAATRAVEAQRAASLKP